MHGKFVDATPFEESLKGADGEHGSESSSLVDELGSMLTAHGFDKYGTEVLYSGVYGTELTCEIFIGPVYYQRLRHMVSDKFQVRPVARPLLHFFHICFLFVIAHRSFLDFPLESNRRWETSIKCGKCTGRSYRPNFL